MKTKIIQIFSLFIIVFFLLGVQYSNFDVVSNSDNIILTWHTGKEDNLKTISVERKKIDGAYSSIALIDAKGDYSSYEFIDENAFKVTDGIYIYRLKFIDTNDSFSLSGERSVTHLTSVRKQTWGSIKALFR